MKVLVTGAAGFIGAHVASRLLARGDRVTGVDIFNDYYDPALKAARAARLRDVEGFEMITADIAEDEAFESLVRQVQPEVVVHLAAQAGVRYSIDNPFAYERSNLRGHLSVLEACRRCPSVGHLVYASSSSVYGDRSIGAGGFREDDPVDAPVSLYAATKRSCELMSAAYARLYGIPQSGLRFFTVYGPMGRPDMAYYGFTRKILAGEPIEVFGEGRMARDFTFIDDIVDGVLGVIDHPAARGEARLYNIGDSRPVALMAMIEILEQALGRPAQKIMRPMQMGDVTETFADIRKLNSLCGYKPTTPLAEGIPRFVQWYRQYHEV
jgi:UDP-glucuronate 4-epimerase